jgi:nitrogen fixation protein FixH
MRLQDGMSALPAPSRWRFFPWALAAGMGVVMVVNFGMAYTALHTFPGSAGNDGFDLSNHYDKVLDSVARQNALGWTVTVEADASDRPVIHLLGRDGAPLIGATITATAERPVGDRMTSTPAFTETAPGTYRAASALGAKGQWDLELSATARGETVNTTRRVIVR